MKEESNTGTRFMVNRLCLKGTEIEANPNKRLVLVLLSLVALILLPFWPYRFGNLNIFWSEIIIISVGVYFFFHFSYSLFISKTSSWSVLLFLLSGSISLIFTPRPIQGLSQYLQYFYIFTVFIPVIIAVFTRYRYRWWAYLCLYTILSIISIIGILYYLAGAHPESIRLFYGNHNGYYWIVSSTFLLNIGFVFGDTGRHGLHVISMLIAGTTATLLIVSISLSALLQAVTGLLLFMSWYLVFEKGWISKAQWTIAIGCISFATLCFIILKWETIYFYGTLSARIPMYTEALRVGVENFPFGAGMGSSMIVMNDLPNRIARSIHNFILHFWVEIGVIGAFGFTLIIVDWSRNVVTHIFKYPNKWKSFEIAIISVFFGYIPVMLFQPHPIRRYWWAFFALGWAAIREKQDINTRQTD